MLQLLAKADDPFSGGRSYYSHPSSRDENKPKLFTRVLQQECRPFLQQELHRELNIFRILNSAV
jgi:hypothetical protein